MTTKRPDYDADLSMYRESPPTDENRLEFQRHLVRSGRQEDDTVSAAELRARDESAHD